MLYFIIGVLLTYSLVSSYLIYRFYCLYKNKVTDKDVEDYLLNNFLDDKILKHF